MLIQLEVKILEIPRQNRLNSRLRALTKKFSPSIVQITGSPPSSADARPRQFRLVYRM